MRRNPLAVLIAATLLPAAALAQTGLTDLGTFGGTHSSALALSADGSTVAGWAHTTGNAAIHAFRWTSASGMVDLGTLGGTHSNALGLSADSSTVVGRADLTGNASYHAFRWTSGTGMVDLGTFGGTHSNAYGVSGDGSVVAGWADTTGNAAQRAFRWTSGTGMVDLGTLGGTNSNAYAVSDDGSAVAGQSTITGNASYHAFRWTSGSGMVDLGTLGGSFSSAYALSGDGSVVVGRADTTGNTAERAFRWTSGSGMLDLGTLGGTDSIAYALSGDGSVVAGWANTAGDTAQRAFRWTSGSGMQSVEDWLRANGVTVPTDITSVATSLSDDGNTVAGQLASGTGFIARVTPIGNGLITLPDVQQSLADTALAGSMSLSAANTAIQSAHSRPLSRRVHEGLDTFWLAGDWWADDHGERHGDLGLAEVGVGRNFGPVQVNTALGRTWARQNQEFNGKTKAEGTYLQTEALVPLGGNLWGVLGGYGHWGQADLRRGYLNAGSQDYSSASPDTQTWSVRGRLEWDQALRLAQASVSPYADLSYGEAKLDAYTENGGGFPARFDARTEKATELRLGVNTEQGLGAGVTLLGTLEAVHRFEENGTRTSGQMLGLFDFDLEGRKFEQDWLLLGVGLEAPLGGGTASVSLSTTTQGEAPSTGMAVSWRLAF